MIHTLQAAEKSLSPQLFKHCLSSALKPTTRHDIHVILVNGQLLELGNNRKSSWRGAAAAKTAFTQHMRSVFPRTERAYYPKYDEIVTWLSGHGYRVEVVEVAPVVTTLGIA